MSALVVFETGHWLRVADARVAASGEVVADALPPHENETVIAVIPGREVIVRRVMLPDLSEPQARAAARLFVAEESATPIETLHVVAGPADDTGTREVVAVEAARVTEHLLDLARLGIDPDHVLAAPLLLPRPDEGFVSGDLGDGPVVRGFDVAFADDASLTPLLTGAVRPVALDRATLEESIVAAVARPWPNLRSGIFAKRRHWALDAARVRRLAALALAFGLLVLATQIVAIARLNARATGLEADNRALASSILPPGTVITDAALQAEARVASAGGAGRGFRAVAPAVGAAIDAVPGADLIAMVYDDRDGLRATVRGSTVADLDAVGARLTSAGLQHVDGTTVATQGKPYREITVRGR